MPAHMQTSPPPQAILHPTTALWERLRALFARVIAAIGAPALLVTLNLAPRLRTALIRQIALIEILARKLLLAEAAEHAPQAQRGPRVVETTLAASRLYTLPQTQRRTRSSARIIDLSNPETWPARFALAIPRDPGTVSDRCAPRIRALWGDAPRPAPAERARGQRNSDAFLVARRAEALRRLLHDPSPYVRRLSRARRIGVARSRQVITRYAFKAPRRFVGDRHDPLLTVHIFSAAVRAHALLLDSG
ncbi:MAG: hypothetical protein KF779_08045 [Hyphomonadaceae bacterium]|nr:hypothetical protein [Hyphomonadaceae bacterium]